MQLSIFACLHIPLISCNHLMLMFFGLLKCVYRKLLEKRMIAGNNYINKKDFLSLYPSACAKVFTPDNICKGFAGAGLKPLNKEWVLAKIIFQLHILASPASVESSVFPVFQTSQNPCQLDHKVHSLQKSLSARKQKLFSSSISYIYYLEKAA